MNERPTPETDRKAYDVGGHQHADGAIVTSDHARNLERQRDEALGKLAALEKSIADLSHPNIKDVLTQRDELLAALEALVEMPDDRNLYEFSKEELAAWESARAAIAAVKGGKL